jgi:hypothetical protein
MKTYPRMKHAPEDVWDFLRRNGVKKVRQVGDEFKFFTDVHGEIKPVHFFTFLYREIRKERPEYGKILRMPRRHPWRSSF